MVSATNNITSGYVCISVLYIRIYMYFIQNNRGTAYIHTFIQAMYKIMPLVKNSITKV